MLGNSFADGRQRVNGVSARLHGAVGQLEPQLVRAGLGRAQANDPQSLLLWFAIEERLARAGQGAAVQHPDLRGPAFDLVQVRNPKPAGGTGGSDLIRIHSVGNASQGPRRCALRVPAREEHHDPGLMGDTAGGRCVAAPWPLFLYEEIA